MSRYGQLGHSDLCRILKDRDQEILELQTRIATGILHVVKNEFPLKPVAVQERHVLNIEKFKKWFEDLFTP